jgi:hypothetical protein
MRQWKLFPIYPCVVYWKAEALPREIKNGITYVQWNRIY